MNKKQLKYSVLYFYFCIAWFPFCIMNLLQVFVIMSFNPKYCKWSCLACFCVSTINPLVYTIFIRNFRLKFIALLNVIVYKNHHDNDNTYYQGHSSAFGSRVQPKNGYITKCYASILYISRTTRFDIMEW
jgi:hypothetical protein